MMKLRQYLKNLVKLALLLKLTALLCLIVGCSSSIEPTYSTANIVDSIQDICKREYDIEVKATLVGRTLWIYVPLEDIFSVSEKPQKYVEKFAIEHNEKELREGILKFEYLVRAIPEEEKYQQVEYNKETFDKMNEVLRVLRRIIFSMRQATKDEPHFFSLIIADIKNGFMIEQLFYYLDLKKVSYQFITWDEYAHRSIQDSALAPEVIGDRQGLHIEYSDIPFEEFITRQIQYRIRLKFQKPEVEQNVDIDKEVLKVAIYTLKTYDFKDFKEMQLNNLLTNGRTTLNQAAVWARTME